MLWVFHTSSCTDVMVTPFHYPQTCSPPSFLHCKGHQNISYRCNSVTVTLGMFTFNITPSAKAKPPKSTLPYKARYSLKGTNSKHLDAARSLSAKH